MWKLVEGAWQQRGEMVWNSRYIEWSPLYFSSHNPSFFPVTHGLFLLNVPPRKPHPSHLMQIYFIISIFSFIITLYFSAVPAHFRARKHRLSNVHGKPTTLGWIPRWMVLDGCQARDFPRKSHLSTFFNLNHLILYWIYINGKGLNFIIMDKLC